jgi:hypothetical protein
LTRDVYKGNQLIDLPVDMNVNDVLDNIQALDFGICPKCKGTRNSFLAKNDLRHYVNTTGICGMRSSKTTLTAMLAWYQKHRLLCLPDPSRYYGQLTNQMFHFTFLALTATQAYDTLWTAFATIGEGSPWVQHYLELLRSEGKRLSQELFSFKDSFVYFAHKHLLAYYIGANIRTHRGRTRVFTAVDEISYFDCLAESFKITANGEETHHMLIKGLRTVRSAAAELRDHGYEDAPDGLNCDISSPASLNDPGMRLLKESATDETSYGWHYATWDFNPKISMSSLKSEMKDRIIFERDYGAIPPLADNPFISDENVIIKSQRQIEPANKAITWARRDHTDPVGDKSIYIETKVEIPERSLPRVITVDTGYDNNSYAVGMYSYDKVAKKINTDLIVEAMPDGDEVKGKCPVNFPLMFEKCVLPLVEGFKVIYVVYDRWQSIDAVQRLKEKKIKAEFYSLRPADFQVIKSTLLDGEVILPKAEQDLMKAKRSNLAYTDLVRNNPALHLMLQILTVREIGRKVVKPIGGTDDLFRTLALAIAYIKNVEKHNEFEQGSLSGRGQGSRANAAMRSNRSGAIKQAISTSGTVLGVRKGFTQKA